MIIEKYCSRRMTGNKITARTIVREKKLKRLERRPMDTQKTYGTETSK